jgi:fucose permease
MEIAIVYIGLCFIIALIGSDRKFGFWGYFFCSLALTPCVGTVVLLASDKRPKQKAKTAECVHPPSETKMDPP